MTILKRVGYISYLLRDFFFLMLEKYSGSQEFSCWKSVNNVAVENLWTMCKLLKLLKFSPKKSLIKVYVCYLKFIMNLFFDQKISWELSLSSCNSQVCFQLIRHVRTGLLKLNYLCSSFTTDFQIWKEKDSVKYLLQGSYSLKYEW